MNAPVAGAEVTGVSVNAGAAGLLAGCAYTVVANVSTAPYQQGAVTFYNDESQIPGYGDYHADNGTVTTTWTPRRVGGQNITAVQTDPGGFNTRKYIRVEVVGNGADTGSGCTRTA
ncbi:hypothetical protein ACFVUS_38160 [Nocardia sp. NPDC058058]|uniref:hypothetical protein n=1 Tax=Nocardia sp. NPDC058058 TaxID=3346317 RepID=UPI0036D990C2